MNRSTVWALLLWLFVTAAALGETVARIQFHRSFDFGLISMAVQLGLLYLWFAADASENRIVPSANLGLAVATMSIVAIPYYLIRYKGWRRALVVVAKVLTALIISGIAVTSFEEYVLARR